MEIYRCICVELIEDLSTRERERELVESLYRFCIGLIEGLYRVHRGLIFARDFVTA